MDSSVEKNNLISGEYKYRAYHSSHRNNVLLTEADIQTIQTLDFGKSTDIKYKVFNLLFVIEL